MNDEPNTTESALIAIANELCEIKGAIQEQTDLLEKCILQPDSRGARIMIGFYGPVETLEL